MKPSIKVNVMVFGLHPGMEADEKHPHYEQLARWAENEDKMSGAVICEFVEKADADAKAKADDSPVIDMDRARKVAGDLLKGEGLNHSSWLRGMGLDKDKDRKKTKPVYDEIFNSFDGMIKKQQNDWFFNESSDK